MCVIRFLSSVDLFQFQPRMGFRGLKEFKKAKYSVRILFDSLKTSTNMTDRDT